VLSGRIHGYHLGQVTTGFCELAYAGVVDLAFATQEPAPAQGKALIEATIEGRHVVYDTRDGNNLFQNDSYDGENFDRELDTLSMYFKRSYDPPHYATLRNAHKIRPLGLNYRVSSRHNTVDRGTHPFDPRQLVKGVIERNRLAASVLKLEGGRAVWVENFEHPPEPDKQPAVLFMARLWDPYGEQDADARQQRVVINETRVACVRALRESFGPRFVGGLAANDYAKKLAPDCLLPSVKASDKRRYLDRVRSASICVATTGLHDSIGWKMAEYVAASKAIVSEPLLRALPGSFSPGLNYLEFTSPDELVLSIERLLADSELRSEMMCANRNYYESWVRPSSLILNTIETVLGQRLRPSSE
jgi:hypothetical protein